MVAMLIDHIGAAVLTRVIYDTGSMDVYDVYLVLRKIGRIAFPIFCFLLVEGFVHTSNVKKYAMRLACFALLSEIPFDLAFQSKVFGWEYQNVFFTLFLGLVAMMGHRYIEEKIWQNKMLCTFLQIVVWAICAGIAELLHTDYAALGVLCIILLYELRERRFMQVIIGCILFVDNRTAMFGFLLTLFYKGARGIKLKYVFYLFYPVHLLILYVVCYFMGLAGYAAI